MIRATMAVGALALLVAGAPLMAQDAPSMQDPCEEFQIHSQLDSMLADGYGRVCNHVGAVLLTTDCMNYYLRITSGFAPPDAAAKAQLAAICEASQPGGSMLGPGGGGIDAPLLECGEGDLECRPEPPDPAPDAPCGGEGEPPCPPVDAPPAADDLPAIDPVGATECGEGELECRPTEDVPVAETPAADTGAGASDVALDLAFWQSIADSDDPALFEAYLARFPQGTFRPIAEARLRALREAAAPAPAPEPQAPALASDRDDPDALYAAAMSLLDAVYARPPAEWRMAAREPVAMLERAASRGQAEAMIELGSLAEQGIGMPADPYLAVRYYVRGGEAGITGGYFRALMVLDAVGDNTGFVSLFEEAYRVSPMAAFEMLGRDVSRQASVWLQQALRAKRYYTGPIDGAFGPASQAAFEAYMAGDPLAPPAPAPRPDADTEALARALQGELARVGCYQGAIDGKWGPASAEALYAFNYWMAGTAPTGRPTQAALDAVRAAEGLVCGVD